ncbi:MAG: hypothetical protein RR313_08510 [Anaerovoracaceae bacterium]
MYEKNIEKVFQIYEVIYLLLFGIWQTMNLLSINININLEGVFVVLSIVSILLILVDLLKRSKQKNKRNLAIIVMQGSLTLMILGICIL